MIRVCVPFYQEFETCKSGIKELLEHGGFEKCFRQGTYIHELRNDFITDENLKGKYEGVAKGYTHFLFIDSDIGFKKEDILKLISHDKDIVCAPYKAHNRNHYWVFKTVCDKQFFYRQHEIGFKEVDGCGFGCILIKREVFESMTEPWFYHPLVKIGNRMKPMGEDLLFCKNAKEHGFKIFCDFDIKIYHKPRKSEDFNWKL